MSVDFQQPAALALLPVCLVLVVFVWATSRAYMPPLRRIVSLSLRGLLMTALVVLLAGPLVRMRSDELSVAVLLDRSDSVSTDAQVQEEEWLRQVLAAKAPQDKLAVVTFAGDAGVERPLSSDSQSLRLSSAQPLHPTRTDIAAAIRVGLAALSPDAARRLVVISDGAENQEQAMAAASIAAAAGVQLDAVPIQQAQTPEALVQTLELPTHARQGDQLSATAVVQSTVAQAATLHLLVDDQLASDQQVDLVAGSNRLVVPVDPLSAGTHVVRVQMEAAADTLAENNAAAAYVVVSGPARVLVVEGTPGDGQYLVDALRTGGLQVDVSNPSAAPLTTGDLHSYASVVLANVAASDLQPTQMSALQSFVQNEGGGLVLAGGDRAFGPGGYARTPLEAMSPVSMDLRGSSVSASTALVLVIDTSGSMGGGNDGNSKMELAKQAAAAAAQSLGEYDQIGVVAFEDTPRWVIQPTSASDLSAVDAAISTMQPGGGTEIYPALQMAYDGLAPLDAKVKHVILLTDGQAPSGDYPGLAARMKDAHITLSTLGIGSDADTALLQELAQLGGGQYYDGNDPFNLPQLVVKDTQQVQRAAIVEQDVHPHAVGSSPDTQGIDTAALPALRGYVATTPKPQSNVLLVSGQLDPLLTEWQYGLGHVVAWTSDLRNRWATPWLEWPAFTQFWSQTLKHTMLPPQDPNRQVTVQLEGSQVRLRIDALSGGEGTDRQYLNFLPTTASIVDPHGQSSQVDLPQVAPGRYEAVTPAEAEGVYSVQIRQTNPDGSITDESSGFVVPYSPEYAALGVDQEFLGHLASLTNGRVLDRPEDVWTHDLPSAAAPRPIFPWLLALVALLLVADIGVRRVRFTTREAHAAYAVLRRRLGAPEARPVAAPPVHETHAARAPAARASIVRRPLVPTHRGAPSEDSIAVRSGRLLDAKRRARMR